MKYFLIIFLFSFSILAQNQTLGEKNEKNEELQLGNLEVKISYQSMNVQSVLDDVRVFIGKEISLNRKDLRDVRPVILIPVKNGWMYLNGRAEKMIRTNSEGIAKFENLSPGKYKIVAAWWKKEAKIQEIEVKKGETIKVQFKF